MKPRKYPAEFLKRLACCVLFAALPALAAAQQTLLDEKSRYEREMEDKLNESIFRILGPSKARVMVHAEMDFSRTERISVEGGSSGPSNFKWADIAPDNSRKSGPQLLPGFPVPASMPGSLAAQEQRPYSMKLSYPPSFVKKLKVVLVVNTRLTAAEADGVRTFVSGILNLDPARGDEIETIRAPFASLWSTIWFTPEMAVIVFKYGVMSLALIGAVLITMFTISKFSRSFTPAAGPQHVSMDVTKQVQVEGAEPAAGEEPGSLENRPATAEAPKEIPLDREPSSGEAVFKVRLDQVPALVQMMIKESPANTALVAARLPVDIRSAFLKALPAELSSEVIASMAELRFVKPDIIYALKEELERRFSGAVGGLDKVLPALDGIGLKAKRDIMLRLEAKYPQVAKKVRAKTLFFEDLMRLQLRDISLLISSVKVDDWAAALGSMDEAFREKLKGQMAERTWQMVEQSQRYAVTSEEKVDKAIENIVLAAARLIKEGRITDPLQGREQELMPEDAAGRA